MPNQLPIVFRTGGAPTLNVNFTDALQGAGILTFYGATSNPNISGADFDDNINFISGAAILTTSAISSDLVHTRAGVLSGANFTKKIDLDFDVTVNVPMTVKGIASITIPLKTWHIYTNGRSTRAFAYVEIRKVHNGVESKIGGASGAIIALIDKATTARIYDHERTSNIRIDLPSTTFAKGDTLRMTVEVHARKAAQTMPNGWVCLGHDPKDRIDTTTDPNDVPVETTFISPESTKMILNLPIKIDL